MSTEVLDKLDKLNAGIQQKLTELERDELYQEVRDCYTRIETMEASCTQSAEAIKVLATERDKVNKKYRSMCEDIFTVLPAVIKLHREMYENMAESLRLKTNKQWNSNMEELETLWNAAKKEAQI